DFVTVDTELPSSGNYYDHITHANPGGTSSTELWVALAEKAYAEENESGWIGTNSQGLDSYPALSNGWPSWALSAITRLSTTVPSLTGPNVSNAWNNGNLLVLCTGSSPASSTIVPDHCYALVDYNSSNTSPFTLYNPWGLNAGLVTA